MNHTYRILLSLFVLLSALPGAQNSYAQGLLDKQVSIDLTKKPLGDVLSAIGRQGNFYFSYNTGIVNKDSLVTLSVHNKTVKQALDLLFGENNQYKETDNYIIIKPAEKEKWYAISGYITDALTGQKVADASVYEKQQLASTLTNADGHFKLYLKDRERYAVTEITVSKGFYVDTNILLLKGYDQEITLAISPATHMLPDIVITQYSSVERSWFGKYLFSDKLRKQSANLGKFFVEKPVQASLIPGLGSHGKMSGQVTNTVSFNILGGYAAGVNGFELGGLFNIDKKDVKYLQIAGIFNAVYGNTEGVQIGGIANLVSKSVSGVQISGIASKITDSASGIIVAGISSYIGGNMKGVQISGIVNHVDNKDSTDIRRPGRKTAVKGIQVAGISNAVVGNTWGVQIAGLTNRNKGDMKGVQIAGLLNKAHKLLGSQIGLINIVDTVTGFSFGLINIVKNGYHKIGISSNEFVNLNFTYKAGNRNIYSILTVGVNTLPNSKAVLAGYGIGTDLRISKYCSVSLELTSQNLYLGNEDKQPAIVRFEPVFNLHLGPMLMISAGPALTFCSFIPEQHAEGYMSRFPEHCLYNFNPVNNSGLWIGWTTGIHIF